MGSLRDRSQLILGLCESWVASATAGGQIQLAAGTEQYRLRNNGLEPHDFSYAELRAACLGLTRVLLVPGMNTFIDWDHFLLWSWCAEILIGPHGQFFGAREREIKDLFGLASRASIAGAYPPGRQGWELSQRRWDAMEPNARELVMNSTKVLPYLALPLLEAILKKVCAECVNYSGDVIAPFQLGTRTYKPGEWISSLKVLLSLLFEHVAGPDLKQALSDLRQHLSQFSTEDPFGMVYRWRNDSFHGAAMLPTIGGTVLTTTLIIAIDQIAPHYDGIRQKTMEQIAREAQTHALSGHRSPWSYYPPWL